MTPWRSRFAPYGSGLHVALRDGTIAWLRPPPPDAAGAHARAGQGSNLRVCRSTFEVVPLLPIPAADTVWAPEELCAPP